MRIIGPRSNSKFPAGSTTVGSTKRLGRLRGGPCKHLLSHSAESGEKGYQSMSRRTILSLAASAIIGIGFIGTVSTDASAYRGGVYRGGVYRGGVYRGGVYRGGFYRGVRPGVAVGI